MVVVVLVVVAVVVVVVVVAAVASECVQQHALKALSDGLPALLRLAPAVLPRTARWLSIVSGLLGLGCSQQSGVCGEPNAPARVGAGGRHDGSE